MSYELKQTILYLDQVSGGYGSNIILKDIILEEKDVVRPGVDATGQIIAFVGRSGRGKSTLFKMLTGLVKPMSGRVLITNSKPDEPESAKEVSEGDVGFVDQKYTLFRHKTVYDIMMYALKRNKSTTAEKKQLIDESLTTWGMIEHKDKYPCELSGGQRQRTAIIEQLLTSKHFMVFDEPCSGLDVGNIESVKEAFNLILSSDELNTIIFSTHDLKLAAEIADVIYIIGHPEGVTDYSTIVAKYDLKELGLAWTKFGVGHLDLIEKIKHDLLKS
jgi:polar amino acid transport system ATP-binding protein